MPYIGSELARGFATTTKQSFSGDASTVAFTLTRNAGQATDLEVFVDNVQQEPTTAYGVSGTTLTFTAAPSTGTNNIYVIHRGGGSTGNLPPQDLGSKNYLFRGVISTPTDGTSNLRLGLNAGDAIASGGNFNVVIGDEAGTAITTGDANVALGYAALDALSTGINNTTVGWSSGGALTQGTRNTAIGYASLDADTLGSKSTALGYSTLGVQNFTTATDSFNVAVGHEAGAAVTTGIRNTLLGALAGDALTDADFNVALGVSSLTSDTLGSRSTAIGTNALFSQNFTTATDTYNTAVGF